MIRLGLAIAYLAATTPVQASDWYYLTTDQGFGVHFAEAKSLQRTGDTATMWNLIINPLADAKGVKTTKDLFRYDCAKLKVAMLGVIQLNDKGATIDRHMVPPNEVEEFDVDIWTVQPLRIACGMQSDALRVDDPYEWAKRELEMARQRIGRRPTPSTDSRALFD